MGSLLSGVLWEAVASGSGRASQARVRRSPGAVFHALSIASSIVLQRNDERRPRPPTRRRKFFARLLGKSGAAFMVAPLACRAPTRRLDGPSGKAGSAAGRGA